MKLSSLLLTSAFVFAGFTSAQACEYMNKTMTLNSGSNKSQQISQEQSPALPAEQQKLLADSKKPLSNTN